MEESVGIFRERGDEADSGIRAIAGISPVFSAASPEGLALPKKAFAFFPPFRISFSGSLPLLRLSFVRVLFESLDSTSCESGVTSSSTLLRVSFESPSTALFSSGDEGGSEPTIASGSTKPLSFRLFSVIASLGDIMEERQRTEPAMKRVATVAAAARKRGSPLREIRKPSCSPSSMGKR